MQWLSVGVLTSRSRGSREEQHRKKSDVQMFGLNVWNA